MIRRTVVAVSFLSVSAWSTLFAANSDVVVTELATGLNNGYQWLEIYNRGTGRVDVANWQLWSGGNYYTIARHQGSTMLTGSTYAVVAQVATSFLNSNSGFKGTLLQSSFPPLSTAGGTLTLVDANSNIVETVSYISNPTGTLERRNYDWADYSAANWEKSASPTGTPNKQNTRKWARVYFNFAPSSNGSSEVPIDTAFINLVNSATGSVWGAFYQLNRQGVVNCLCNAKTNRHVDVRFVTDTDYFTDANYTNSYAQLQRCGITVKADNRSSLMHDKFAVVDGRYVWSGSWNATNSGTTNDVQNAVIIDSASLAGAYSREFDQFWTANAFSTAKTTGGTNSHTVAGATVRVFFSPKDGVTTNVVNVTKTALGNNYFDIFTFTDASIKDAIVANRNKGLAVQGLMDSLQAGSSYSQYSALVNAGVNTKKDAYRGLLHHKVMLVDAGNPGNAKLITGSFNWTGSANTANDENIVVIYDYDIANIFYQEFLVNWKK